MASPLPGAVGSVMKIAIVGRLYSQTVVNTMFYRVVVAASDPDPLANMALDAGGVWIGTVMNDLAADYKLHRVECSLVVNPGDPASRSDYNVPDQAGAVTTSVACPPAVAAIIRKRTAFIGRRYRGRNYIPGIPVGSVSVGQLTGGAATSLQTDSEAMYLGNIAVTDSTMVVEPVLVGNDSLNMATYPIGRRVTPLVSVDVDVVLRQQRRREVGVGD